MSVEKPAFGWGARNMNEQLNLLLLQNDVGKWLVGVGATTIQRAAAADGGEQPRMVATKSGV